MTLRQDEDRRVVDALNAVEGVCVSSVFDLVNTKGEYTQAIPVLIEFAEAGLRDPLIMEGVVRALTTRHAKGKANKALLALFHGTSMDNVSLKWAIGNAIKAIITPDDLSGVLEIVRDKRHGITRQEFVAALAPIHSPAVDGVLVELLDDEDVAAHAMEALRKRRSVTGVSKARRLLEHPKTVIRKEAEKYLSALGTNLT